MVARVASLLSIALFDCREDAQAAEQTFGEEMPRQLGDLFKDWEGRRVSVDRYEALADYAPNQASEGFSLFGVCSCLVLRPV
jgi:hypothetical protein